MKVNLERLEITGLIPSDIVVHLDNGHGTREYTAGKRSADGRYFEGEWARGIVRMLAGALEVLGFGVDIVVPERMDIPRMDRCRRANSKAKDGKYHIFISIHSNADNDRNLVQGWSAASGMVVYVCEKASDASKILARNLYDAAEAWGLRGNRSVPKARYWVKNWDVITFTTMPAVLTESAFHTNRAEVEYLLSEQGQEDIVNYHVAGICKTFGIPYALCRWKK